MDDSRLIWWLFHLDAVLWLRAACGRIFHAARHKWFGWIFILERPVACCYSGDRSSPVTCQFSAHWLMGFFFGVLHLAYGAYLYLTEKGKNAA